MNEAHRHALTARELLLLSVMQNFRREYFPVARRHVDDRAKFSIPSILAVACALLSFVVSAGWAFILALAAVAFGLLGVILALSPRVRGGMVSIIAMVTGGIGVILALLRLVF